MLDLASVTPRAWLDQAIPQVGLILLDHAHCEKKAASTAMNLIFRYPDKPEMMAPLSALAREELEHFEQVLAVMERRGVPYRVLQPSPYAARLHGAVRRGEPERLLDTLLVCALIEARSCERMKLLAEGLPDEELQAFYRSLLACEARHFHGYVDIAYARYGREATRARLHELAEVEAAALREPSELRLHSGL